MWNVGQIAGIGVSFLMGTGVPSLRSTLTFRMGRSSLLATGYEAIAFGASAWQAGSNLRRDGRLYWSDAINLIPGIATSLNTRSLRSLMNSRAINQSLTGLGEMNVQAWDDVPLPRDAASGPGPVGNQSGTGIECFVAGTLVLTTEGKKAIESLRPGDWVFSWDEETGEVIERQVTEWYRREAPAIVDIFVGVEKISCTLDHPFWVYRKGWVRASQLKAGMVLQSRGGAHLTVDVVRRRDEVTQVHNVEIDGLHTYFISQFEILSHNMCGGTQRGRQELPSLDGTGKVHGQLPDPKDLDQYSRDELIQLRDELEISVQRRIEKTVELGREKAHGQRQGAEQDLIDSINKFLEE